MNDPRTAELAQNLMAVRARIQAACEAAGRPVAKLIVVTKFFGADDVHRLAALGVADVGRTVTRRRRPNTRNAPTSSSPGTSSDNCSPTRRSRWCPTPTWCTPLTGPGWSRRWTRRPTRRRNARMC